MNSQKRLYRSTNDRMFAGVCGGIAEYLDVDPTLVRLVFVALTLMGGPGFIAYLVLMLVVPEQPDEKWKAGHHGSKVHDAEHTGQPSETAESVVRSSVPVASDDLQTPET